MKDNKLNVDELVLYSILYETLKKQGVEDVENEINNLTGKKFDKLAILQRKWQKFDTHDRELVKKWQKLKEWLDRVFQIYLNESDHKMMSIYGTILDKMQELEGEDENTRK